MDKHQSIISKNSQETTALGERVAASVDSNIFCLYGDLGSGKTTFTQGFAKGLGITTRLLSPTFIIVRRYSMPEKTNFLYHIDLYRLQSEKELEDVGISEILNQDHSYVVIEWAERLGSLLPKDRIDVNFFVLEDGKHSITICKTS